MIRYCVVWLGGTIVPYEHSLFTFRVEGQAVIGTEVGTEIPQTETASKLVHLQPHLQLSLSHVHINFSLHCLLF